MTFGVSLLTSHSHAYPLRQRNGLDLDSQSKLLLLPFRYPVNFPLTTLLRTLEAV
jgi:hypothetical protein